MTVSISDAERRARLVARHHLDGSAPDPVAATRSLVALHASDPATPYLSLRARIRDFTTADLATALHEERRLWRLHAMRRTLFVVAIEDASHVEAGAARAIAVKERRRLEGWLDTVTDDPASWLRDVQNRTVAAVGAAGEVWTRGVTAAVPELATEITLGSGRWTTRSPVSSRVLFLTAMDGRIVRTRPAGSWRSSQYGWATVAGWFGDGAATATTTPDPMGEPDGRAALAARYLAAFGPATVTDLRWWTGWTVAQVRAALRDSGAVAITLEDGGEGYLAGDDAGSPASDGEGTVALLPALDPTPMGWKERAWFLAPGSEVLYDTNGNIGPTVWVDGRIVGGWAQRPDGMVAYRLLEALPAVVVSRIEAAVGEASRWFDGTVVTPRFRTPLERTLSAPEPPP